MAAKQVLLACDPGIDERETGNASRVLTQLVATLSLDGPRFLPTDFVEDALKNLTVNPSARLSVEDLYYAFVEKLAIAKGEGFESLSKKFILVVVVAKDLVAPDTDWVYGATYVHVVPISTLSVFKIRQLHESVRKEALARLINHEFGHALGLVPATRRLHVMDEAWTLGKHCTNICAMRQTDVLHGTPTLIEAAVEELSAEIVFCNECHDDLEMIGYVRSTR